MKKEFQFLATILKWFAVVSLSVWVGWSASERYGKKEREFQRSHVEELKVAARALRQPEENLVPQTREYLKARIYSLLARGVRADWTGDDLDFGPVDQSALQGIDPIKGSATLDEVYQFAFGK